MKQIAQFSIIFSLFMVTGLPAIADSVDRDWEKRASDKLAEEVEATEVLWLDAGEEQFLGLYTDQSNEVANGAAIILHAMGSHADWPQIISPLRTKLPEHGWTTLSIQLPVIAPENQIEDYGGTLTQAAARIEAAIGLLRERKFLNIAVIGHSFGAATTLAHIGKNKNQKIVSLVAIGLQEYPFVKPAIDVLKLIEKSNIPILDIYGGRDYKGVINQAPDRRLAAKKADNKHYRQIEVAGADHYFNKMEDVLIKRIRGWLDKAAPGIYILLDDESAENQAE